MWGRALIFATMVSAMGVFAVGPVQAQNLEAGKSPSQIFAGGCAACHKSARGLLKTVSPSALPGFLRQHYTTSSDMASLLASYLVSNGATDTRYQGKQGRDGAKQQEAARPPAEPPPSRSLFPWFSSAPQQAAKPDADGLNPEGEGGRPVRRKRHHPRQTEAPDGTSPAQAVAEPGHRHKGKRSRAGEDTAPKETGSSEPAPSTPEPSAPPADTPAAR